MEKVGSCAKTEEKNGASQEAMAKRKNEDTGPYHGVKKAKVFGLGDPAAKKKAKRVSGWNLYFGHCRSGKQQDEPRVFENTNELIAVAWRSMFEPEREIWNSRARAQNARNAGVPDSESD
jgi:hypothetical protein